MMHDINHSKSSPRNENTDVICVTAHSVEMNEKWDFKVEMDLGRFYWRFGVMEQEAYVKRAILVIR